MASVSLYDDLTLTLQSCEAGEEVFTAGAEGVEGDNLAARAARLFMDAAGLTGWSVHICIEKRIPIRAGLGGGSSDAAAVLRALDGWEKHPAPRNHPLLRKRAKDIPLPALALELGSDVPYCLRGGVCLAQGRGEILSPLPPLPECWIVLCVPPVEVPTAEAFAKYDALGPFHQGLAKMSDNVFEAVTLFPEIVEIRNQANAAFEILYPAFPKTFLTKPV
jgi:4-diphosphocytidyl-2-C-methyl-D-erythritol kinase